MSYTFLDLSIETLKCIKKPLSQREIWDEAINLKIASKINTKGKTPWATLGARIYTDIEQNLESPFIQVSKRPAKFYLKELLNNKDSIEDLNNLEYEFNEKEEIDKNFEERDLHPLLVKAVYAHPHFKCYCKTIFHETSVKKKKGYNKWLHPDIVGIYFPFKDYISETRKLQEAFKIGSFKLFSFELKIDISFQNLREYYFQAVSNSSWANEGYLVSLNIEDDPTLRDELRRLNNSFGIGIIQLNAENIEQSEIILPAKERELLDWETINRLAEDNRDFKNFIEYLAEDIQVGKVKSKYDLVLDEEEYERYIKSKGIKF